MMLSFCAQNRVMFGRTEPSFNVRVKHISAHMLHTDKVPIRSLIANEMIRKSTGFPAGYPTAMRHFAPLIHTVIHSLDCGIRK